MASHFQHPNAEFRSREELIDFFWQPISDSMGPDWSERDGAKAIVQAIEDAGRLKSVLFALKGVL